MVNFLVYRVKRASLTHSAPYIYLGLEGVSFCGLGLHAWPESGSTITVVLAVLRSKVVLLRI